MSTVPAAKEALMGILAAVTWPGNQPEVKYGQPTEGEDWPANGELVFFGESRVRSDFVVLGNKRRDETFNLRFVIDVRAYGDDEQNTELRAWDLYETATLAVIDNPTLNGTVNRVTGIEATQVNQPEPSMWRTQIVADVGYVGLVHHPSL